jgi:LuxR family transcriptional regulator, quorum-sensing system regulator CciR
MSRFEVAQSFVDRSQVLQNLTELGSVLDQVCREMGFRYYALVHHADMRRNESTAIRVENYPAEWAAHFVQAGLYSQDPVHQACLRSNVGFSWAEIPKMIAVSCRQRAILEGAAAFGLTQGYTVPVNIPGEISGSCSFATQNGQALPEDNLLLAQLIGAFSFQAARRITKSGAPSLPAPPRLTPRQRDCLILAIHGKTDWEIARILGLSEETVGQHLTMARVRFGVSKRLQLAVRAIFDGQISLIEALAGQFPLKRE